MGQYANLYRLNSLLALQFQLPLTTVCVYKLHLLTYLLTYLLRLFLSV